MHSSVYSSDRFLVRSISCPLRSLGSSFFLPFLTFFRTKISLSFVEALSSAILLIDDGDGHAFAVVAAAAHHEVIFDLGGVTGGGGDPVGSRRSCCCRRWRFPRRVSPLSHVYRCCRVAGLASEPLPPAWTVLQGKNYKIVLVIVLLL